MGHSRVTSLVLSDVRLLRRPSAAHSDRGPAAAPAVRSASPRSSGASPPRSRRCIGADASCCCCRPCGVAAGGTSARASACAASKARISRPSAVGAALLAGWHPASTCGSPPAHPDGHRGPSHHQRRGPVHAPGCGDLAKLGYQSHDQGAASGGRRAGAAFRVPPAEANVAGKSAACRRPWAWISERALVISAGVSPSTNLGFKNRLEMRLKSPPA